MNNIYRNCENKYKSILGSIIFKEPLKVIDNKKNNYLRTISKLEAINPLLTIKRGYIVGRVDNRVISSSKELKKGNKLELEFHDGKVNTEVI